MTGKTISSTDDRRTSVRSDYRQLSEDEKARIERVKALGDDLIAELDGLGREGALATTKVQEAVMWAVRGVTA